MSSNGARGIASIAGLAALATLASAQAPGSVAYVQASRAHLRDRPSSAAGVSGLLAANTVAGKWMKLAHDADDDCT